VDRQSSPSQQPKISEEELGACAKMNTFGMWWPTLVLWAVYLTLLLAWTATKYWTLPQRLQQSAIIQNIDNFLDRRQSEQHIWLLQQIMPHWAHMLVTVRLALVGIHIVNVATIVWLLDQHLALISLNFKYLTDYFW